MSASSLASYVYNKLAVGATNSSTMADGSKPKLTAVWRPKTIPYDIPKNTTTGFKEDGSLLRLLRAKSMPTLGLEGGATINLLRTGSPDSGSLKSGSPSPLPQVSSRFINPRLSRDLEQVEVSVHSDISEMVPRSPPPAGQKKTLTRSTSDGLLWAIRKKQMRDVRSEFPDGTLPSVKNLKYKFDRKFQEESERAWEDTRPSIYKKERVKVKAEQTPPSSPPSLSPSSPPSLPASPTPPLPPLSSPPLPPRQQQQLKQKQQQLSTPESHLEHEAKQGRSSHEEIILNWEEDSPDLPRSPKRKSLLKSVKKMSQKFEVSRTSEEDERLFHTSTPNKSMSKSEYGLDNTGTSTIPSPPEQEEVSTQPQRKSRSLKKKDPKAIRSRAKSEPDSSSIRQLWSATMPVSVKELTMKFEQQASSSPIPSSLPVKPPGPAHYTTPERVRRSVTPDARRTTQQTTKPQETSQGDEVDVKTRSVTVTAETSKNSSQSVTETEFIISGQSVKIGNARLENTTHTYKTPSVRNLRKRFEKASTTSFQSSDATKTAGRDDTERPRKVIIPELVTPFLSKANTSGTKQDKSDSSSLSYVSTSDKPSSSIKSLLRQFETLSPEESTEIQGEVKFTFGDEDHHLGKERHTIEGKVVNSSQAQVHASSKGNLVYRVDGSSCSSAEEDEAHSGERKRSKVRKSSASFRGSDKEEKDAEDERKKLAREQAERESKQMRELEMERKRREKEKEEKEKEEKEREIQEKMRVEKEAQERKTREMQEREKLKKLRAEEEKNEREDREKKEREKQEKLKAEMEKREREERERAKRERIERERKEKEEQEKIERLRLEKEKYEKEKAEREKERAELEKEKKRIEREREERAREQVRKEKEKAERERREREKEEEEKREKAEQERKEKERMDLERKRKEEEAEKKRKEQKIKEEQERQKREKEEQDKQKREKEEQERQKRERKERERKERERKEREQEQERKKKEQEEKEHRKKEQEEEERRERERLERERKENNQRELKKKTESLERRRSEDSQRIDEALHQTPSSPSASDSQPGDLKVNDLVGKFAKIQTRGADEGRIRSASLRSDGNMEGDGSVGKLIDKFTNSRDVDFEVDFKDAMNPPPEQERRESDVAALVGKFRNMIDRRDSHSSDSDSGSTSAKHKESAPIPTVSAKTIPGKTRTLKEDELKFFMSGSSGEYFARSQSLRVKKSEPSAFSQLRFGSMREKKTRAEELAESERDGSKSPKSMPSNCRMLRPEEMAFFTGRGTSAYSSLRGSKGKGKPIGSKSPPNTTNSGQQQDFRLSSQGDPYQGSGPSRFPGDDKMQLISTYGNSDSDSEGEILRGRDYNEESYYNAECETDDLEVTLMSHQDQYLYDSDSDFDAESTPVHISTSIQLSPVYLDELEHQLSLSYEYQTGGDGEIYEYVMNTEKENECNDSSRENGTNIDSHQEDKTKETKEKSNIEKYPMESCDAKYALEAKTPDERGPCENNEGKSFHDLNTRVEEIKSKEILEYCIQHNLETENLDPSGETMNFMIVKADSQNAALDKMEIRNIKSYITHEGTAENNSVTTSIMTDQTDAGKFSYIADKTINEVNQERLITTEPKVDLKTFTDLKAEAVKQRQDYHRQETLPMEEETSLTWSLNEFIMRYANDKERKDNGNGEENGSDRKERNERKAEEDDSDRGNEKEKEKKDERCYENIIKMDRDVVKIEDDKEWKSYIQERRNTKGEKGVDSDSSDDEGTELHTHLVLLNEALDEAMINLEEQIEEKKETLTLSQSAVVVMEEVDAGHTHTLPQEPLCVSSTFKYHTHAMNQGKVTRDNLLEDDKVMGAVDTSKDTDESRKYERENEDVIEGKGESESEIIAKHLPLRETIDEVSPSSKDTHSFTPVDRGSVVEWGEDKRYMSEDDDSKDFLTRKDFMRFCVVAFGVAVLMSVFPPSTLFDLF